MYTTYIVLTSFKPVSRKSSASVEFIKEKIPPGHVSFKLTGVPNDTVKLPVVFPQIEYPKYFVFEANLD